jgi:hypothetical protein
VIRGLAVAVVLLLVADGVGLAVTSADDRPAATTPPAAGATGGSATTAGSAPTGVLAVVPAIERFVEAERGLTFKTEVKVALLDDAAFKKRLRGDGKTDTATQEKADGFLRALHLLSPGVHLDAAVNDLLASAVAGVYDPKKKELFVRGGQPTPSVRAVLAHELTHALQDQYFNLDRPALENRSDEVLQGFTGLVEGDAVRVQRRYYLSLPRDEKRAFLAEEAAQPPPPKNVPPVLIRALGFPYQWGPPFVDALQRAGGRTRVDAAFAAPPETSEQVMHPDAFLRGEGALPVTEPPADGAVFDRGVVGEFGFLLILYDAVGPVVAQRAAAGWGGDHYVSWRRGKQVCVRASVVMDTARDALELEAALQTWSAAHAGVKVTGGSPLTLTSCA